MTCYRGFKPCATNAFVPKHLVKRSVISSHKGYCTTNLYVFVAQFVTRQILSLRDVRLLVAKGVKCTIDSKVLVIVILN